MTTNAARRELTRQFILERVPARYESIPDELLWALGKPPPRDFVEPPPWVKIAVLRLARGPMKPHLELFMVQSQPTPEQLGKARGVLLAGRALFESPSVAMRNEEARSPALKTFREKMGEVATRNLAMPIVENPVPANPPKIEAVDEIQSLIAGTQEGSQLVSELGAEETSMADELCFLLWIFWPEASTAKNRKELHAWIEGLGVLRVSFQNLQKLCREIGFRPAKRGRPRSKHTSPG